MKPILINLDLKNNGYNELELKQGCQDTLIATISDLGEVVSLVGQVVAVEMLKADDTFIIQSNDITVLNNTLTIKLNKDLTRVSGKGKLQIKMTKDTIITGSWVVNVRIRKAAIDDAVGESGNIVTIKEELDNSIASATATNTTLVANTTLANTANTNLTAKTTTANTTNTTLTNTNATATTTNTTLVANTTLANTANTNLTTKTTTANTTNTTLTNTNATATTTNTTLNTTITNANNAKTALDASIAGGNLALKQNVTDNALTTTSKTIVGAINEHESDIIGISSSMAELTSNKPFCRIYNTNTQSISNNLETLLNYNTAISNIGDMYNIASPTRLTIKKSGIYLVNLTVDFAQNSIGLRYASIKLNGTIRISESASMAITEGGYGTSVKLTLIREFSINDYVEATVTQKSGGALNVTGNIDRFSFDIIKVG